MGHSLPTQTRDTNPRWLIPHRKEWLQECYTLSVLWCFHPRSFSWNSFCLLCGPSWACLSLLSQTCSAESGEHRRDFLSNTNHPRTCSSSPSLRKFRQEMTGISVPQESLFPRNPCSPYPKSIQHTQGPAHDVNTSVLPRTNWNCGALLLNKALALISQPSSSSQQADCPPPCP